MRKMIFATALAVCVAANAYVVRIDNLPEITKGYRVLLKSVRTGQTLDSAVATGTLLLTARSFTVEYADRQYLTQLPSLFQKDRWVKIMA